MLESRRDFFRLASLGLVLAAGRYCMAGAASSAPAEPERRFQVRQVGGRWMFLDPGGHPYWMLGVFNAELDDARFAGPLSLRSCCLSKYGSESVWARQAVRRMRAWGFNCLAEYASEYTLPIALYGRPGNPEQMPFMAMIRPAKFSLTNRWGYAKAPVKDIVAATDPAVYRGWRGSTLPDVYDPNFALYAQREAAALATRYGFSSFLLGVTCDDADDLYGFGPGPALPAARLHAHPGWMVLIANPEQSHNPALGVSYTDTRLHAKVALLAELQGKYGTIARLNQAWGARYRSFDSAGGWPHGHGLLDESGRSPWVGRGERMTGANAALRADLNTFLGHFAAQYFQSAAAAVRRAFPGYLVFGPATLNGWNGLTRAPILRAAGAAVDVLQANAGSPELLRRTVLAAGNVPLVTWTGMSANPDSDLFAYPNAEGALGFGTQAERGAAYAVVMDEAWNHAAASGAHPVVGTKFWAFADSWQEKMNWGLVSLRDNAYDGREAVRAFGHDHWGFVTGGEPRDFGDSVTLIQAANRRLYERLWRELAA